VSAQIAERLRGGSNQLIEASDAAFGDPAPGRPKILLIEVSTQGGSEEAAEAPPPPARTTAGKEDKAGTEDGVQAAPAVASGEPLLPADSRSAGASQGAGLEPPRPSGAGLEPPRSSTELRAEIRGRQAEVERRLDASRARLQELQELSKNSSRGGSRPSSACSRGTGRPAPADSRGTGRAPCPRAPVPAMAGTGARGTGARGAAALRRSPGTLGMSASAPSLKPATGAGITAVRGVRR
jgi:hypothetical protein